MPLKESTYNEQPSFCLYLAYFAVYISIPLINVRQLNSAFYNFIWLVPYKQTYAINSYLYIDCIKLNFKFYYFYFYLILLHFTDFRASKREINVCVLINPVFCNDSLGFRLGYRF